MQRKKMISNSSLQKFNFQGPPCLNNYYLPKMQNGLDPFAMEEKKNTPNEKEYQESVTGTAKLQTNIQY